MALQQNSVLFFTFNLFYLIVFHLSSLGGEVLTMLCIRRAARNAIVSKTVVERDTFTKKCLRKCHLHD